MSVFESDVYKMTKSEEPQSVASYTPFSSEQFNYINDINSGVYSSNPTLVQFDLTSITNSRKFMSVEDTYLAIPITMVAQYATAGALGVAPTATLGTLGGSAALMSLKSSSQCLVHQVELSMGGQVVSDLQPFTNIYKGFRLLSDMSAGTDLKQAGTTLGVSECGVDNPNSLCYNSTLNASALPTAGAFSVSGGGLTNNRPFAPTTSVGLPWQVSHGPQNQLCTNEAVARRVSRIVDATGSGSNGIYGPTTGSGSGASLMSSSQLAGEFKPYCTVLSPNLASTAGSNYMVWYDVAVLPLRFLCDVVDKCPLMKKTDMLLRIYLNTGSCIVPVVRSATSGQTQYFAPQSSNFVNTCPFTLNYIDTQVPATTTGIACGIFVGKAQATSLSISAVTGALAGFTPSTVSCNLGLSGASHPMNACRCYYSMVELDPDREEQYILANSAKSVVFEQFIYNQYNNITAGSNFSQLVASGIKSPIGAIIIPFISTSNVGVSGTGTLNFPAQYSSPFDTCGGLTFSPLSLTNLQCYLGGVAQLQNSLYYTYENFIQQVSTFENVTGNQLDILSRGIINQATWEASRVYYVNLARGDPADRVMPRNLQVSFTNNTGVAMDVMIFCVYLDKITVDVKSGVVRK